MSRRKTADALPIRVAPVSASIGVRWRWLNKGEIVKSGDMMLLEDFVDFGPIDNVLVGSRAGNGEMFARMQIGVGKGNRANPAQHSAAGKLGGAKVSKDRKHMAKIGRKGGQKVAQDKAHMAEIGRRGGKAGPKGKK